ncbi:MAG: DUF4168 domain-containing protein [Gammaproteobacteria bacterium]|nr:DUF4168 domain-containing protein [Gammaproteobacteria bacterium]
MKHSLTSLAVASAVLGFGSAAWAQGPAQPPAPPPAEAPAPSLEPQATDVSEEDLDTFAEIYVELQETATKFESEMSEVEDEQEAQEVQSRMQQESIDKIAEHGWTPEKYNRVAQTVNADPALIEKTLALIEEKS